MDVLNTMRLNEGDVYRLTTACKLYQEQTGSEYMYDEYQHLIEKINTMCEQGYCAFTESTP
tara:strand:+ start:1333 stop:1515 length:183 start_codon:yes stop_codon:yes gene_type:complete